MLTRFLLLSATLTAPAPAPTAVPPTQSSATREIGTLVLENVLEIPAELTERLRPYQNARSASFQDWLGDGSMLITQRFGQTSQLHRVARPGMARTQLTFPAMRAHLERISPLNMTSRMTKPLLVFQGANDPRVPRSESDQLVAGLRAQGGEVWYILARDEGQGIQKKPNADVVRAVELLFLRRLFAGRRPG